MKPATLKRMFLKRDFEFIYRKYIESSLRYSPKRFLPKWDKIILDRPIFFLGVQGGGMTLIVRMLARNKRVITATGNHKKWAFRDELAMQYPSLLPDSLTSQFYFLRPFLKKYPEILNPAVVLTEAELEDLPEKYRRLYLRYGPLAWWNYASNNLLPYFQKDETHYNTKEALQFVNILKRAIFLGRPLNDSSGYRFVDKSQIFSVKIRLLDKILAEFNPIYVVVVRNPYAICFRAATQGYIPQRDSDPIRRFHTVAQHYANTYRSILASLKNVPKERQIIINIEEFLQTPRESLQNICKVCDLEFSDDMLPQPYHKIPWGAGDKTKWFPIRQNINERYLKEITPQACDIIESYAGEIAAKFNYERPK